MRKLTLKLIFPLSVISFAVITKWWYALPVDGPGSMFAGFPFPFVCEGWHTSMALQFFGTEFLLDIFIYFTFWFIVIFCVDRFWKKVNPNKLTTILLWLVTGLIIATSALIASNKNNLFYVRRPFNIEVMETGYKFIWQRIERPGSYKYHPEKKKQ